MRFLPDGFEPGAAPEMERGARGFATGLGL